MKSTASAGAPVKTGTATKTNISVKRGVKKEEVVEKLKTYRFPAQPITIKQAVEDFGIDHWLLIETIKKSGTVVGDAPRENGARGKAAKLYQMPTEMVRQAQ